MKLVIIILFLFQIAQPKSGTHKSYAYAQIISGGAHPIITDSIGDLIETAPSRRIDYYIYIEIKRGVFTVDSLKIGLQIFKAVTEKSKTPVIKPIQAVLPGKEKSFTLVPRTSNSVYRIFPQSLIRYEKQHNKSNFKDKVIIYYKIDGRRYTKTIEKIIMLPEEIRQ